MSEIKEEWSSERVGRFTASNISKLLKTRTVKNLDFGDGAMTYIREKIHEAMTGQAKFTPTTFAMQRGLDLEPNAIKRFSEVKKMEVEYFGTANPKFFVYNEFAGSSPDGLTEKAVIETKCLDSKHLEYLSISKGVDFRTGEPYTGTMNEWLKDYDFDYYCQIEMNMFVCDKKHAYMVCYDDRMRVDGTDIAILRIEQDVELQNLIKEKIQKASDLMLQRLNIFGL